MLSIKPISNAAHYRCYLEKEGIGQWVGTGAEILGLPQEVTVEDFRAIRKGLDPATGEPLRIRNVVDRQYQKPWGVETYYAREMYDLVISPPKSISIQGMVDPRIQEAHREAVAEVRRNMEQACGAMVIAQYEHGTSRKLDPQIHTHLLAANLAHKGKDWRTLGANTLYRGHKDITEDYRAKLNEMLESWGYRVEGIELEGISRGTRERFSQRAIQISEQVRDLGLESATTGEQHVIANRYRPQKPKAEAEEIRAYQMARLSQGEHAQLEALVGHALERSEKLAPWVAPHLRSDVKPELRQSEQRTHPKLSLDDAPHFEPGLKREDWEYGEGYRQKRGQRIGL